MTNTSTRTGTAPSCAAVLRVTPRRVLAAESLKFSSLRSTRWLLIGSALSILAAGIFPALGVLLAGLGAAPPATFASTAPSPNGCARSFTPEAPGSQPNRTGSLSSPG